MTYTLSVDVGFRKDVSDSGTVALIVGSNTITNPITSPPQGSGDWVTDTITYTATALDAGAPISIFLSAPDPQGNWDNVRLSDDSTVVPEPIGLALLGTGLAALGIFRRRAARALKTVEPSARADRILRLVAEAPARSQSRPSP